MWRFAAVVETGADYAAGRAVLIEGMEEAREDLSSGWGGKRKLVSWRGRRQFTCSSHPLLNSNSAWEWSHGT